MTGYFSPFRFRFPVWTAVTASHPIDRVLQVLPLQFLYLTVHFSLLSLVMPVKTILGQTILRRFLLGSDAVEVKTILPLQLLYLPFILVIQLLYKQHKQHTLSVPTLVSMPAMLRCVLLAGCVLGAVAQDQTCDVLSMTVKGGPCDGMKAPAKACGAKSFMSVRTKKLNLLPLEWSAHDECCCITGHTQ